MLYFYFYGVVVLNLFAWVLFFEKQHFGKVTVGGLCICVIASLLVFPVIIPMWSDGVFHRFFNRKLF